MRELLVSTGTMVSRLNGFDYKHALGEIATLRDKELCDGLELMMLPFYYDKVESVIQAVRDCGVNPATIHCEKEVGTLLSDAGALFADEQREEADRALDQAFAFFRENCRFAEELRIPRMVLHLWGGMNSDSHIEFNIAKLPELEKMAEEYGVRLLIENIPSQKYDPRSNWHKLLPSLRSGGLIFDTRFGCLHDQSAEILTDRELTPRIEHIHISDFGGGYRDFKALRPILHPGEGNVDFEKIARLLDAIPYTGTVTLESPVALTDGTLDLPKLEKTLAYLRKSIAR